MSEHEAQPRPVCPICRHERHDWSVCPGCVARVDRQLADLLDLHALAQNPAALTPAVGSRDSGSGHREPPAPVSIAALDLAIGEDLLGVLESWERWWREHFELMAYGQATARLTRRGPADPTLTHVIGFLRAWWPRAATVIDPPPQEFADEVRRLHSRALGALRLTPQDLNPDIPERPDWIIRCPADIDDHGTMCGHRIGVTAQPMPLDGQPPAPVTVNCERCGAHWDTRRLIDVAIAAGQPVEMDLAQIRRYYGDCSERTIRRKVADGLLVHHRGRYRIPTGHAQASVLELAHTGANVTLTA